MFGGLCVVFMMLIWICIIEYMMVVVEGVRSLVWTVGLVGFFGWWYFGVCIGRGDL